MSKFVMFIAGIVLPLMLLGVALRAPKLEISIHPPDAALSANESVANQSYEVYFQEASDSDPWTFDSEQPNFFAAEHRCLILKSKLDKHATRFDAR